MARYLRLLTALALSPWLLAASPPANLEQALASQRELVEQRPGDAGALNDLANLLVLAGDVEAAEAAYHQALGSEPGHAAARFNLALLYQESDRSRLAMKELRGLLRDHPDHAWGHYQLGALHHDGGRRSRALREYATAFELDPTLADPRVNHHVLDNRLATAAMIQAFAEVSAAVSAPRIYDEPARITGLLLPPLTAPAEEPVEQPAAEEPVEEPAAEEPETPAEEEAQDSDGAGG